MNTTTLQSVPFMRVLRFGKLERLKSGGNKIKEYIINI